MQQPGEVVVDSLGLLAQAVDRIDLPGASAAVVQLRAVRAEAVRTPTGEMADNVEKHWTLALEAASSVEAREVEA